jgi:hypothetical protein
MSEMEWDEWARNARRMHQSLLEQGFSEPQALIIVGQMLGSLISTPG